MILMHRCALSLQRIYSGIFEITSAEGTYGTSDSDVDIVHFVVPLPFFCYFTPLGMACSFICHISGVIGP